MLVLLVLVTIYLPYLLELAVEELKGTTETQQATIAELRAELDAHGAAVSANFALTLTRLPLPPCCLSSSLRD